MFFQCRSNVQRGGARASTDGRRRQNCSVLASRPASSKAPDCRLGEYGTLCAEMRALVVAACLVTTASLWEAPVKSNGAQPQTAELRVGQALQLANDNASLIFKAVESDSRCPKDARCIRAGEAVVVLQLQDTPGAATVLTLKVPPEGQASQSARGYQITILRLDPQAELDIEIPPSDYVTTIAVQKTP